MQADHPCSAISKTEASSDFLTHRSGGMKKFQESAVSSFEVKQHLSNLIIIELIGSTHCRHCLQPAIRHVVLKTNQICHEIPLAK